MRSTRTQLVTQSSSSSSWLGKPPGPCLLGSEGHTWGKAGAGTGCACTFSEPLVELKLEGVLDQAMAAAQLLVSVGSGQGTVCATRTRATASEEGASFSLSNTCNRDASLTVVKPKNPRILQPIQTV